MKSPALLRRLRLAAAAAPLALLTACTWPFPVNYAPSSALIVSGAVHIGDFRYTPADTGKVRPDQIANTSWQDVILDVPIATLFHDAVLKELRQTGVRVGVPQPVLTGTIDTFTLRDSGMSIGWELTVTYRLARPGLPDFVTTKTLRRTTGKMTNRFGALNESIKLAIEQLLLDPAFLAALGESS